MNQSKSHIKAQIRELRAMFSSCTLCPHMCGIDRTRGQSGVCRAGIMPAVFSYGSHPGEEPPISGTRGSGTIFFTHCNMSCVYCQNYTFSQKSDQGETTIDGLINIMLELQKNGCHNINVVSPTHYAPQIAEATVSAREKGLSIPLVYNTGGYESPRVIELLDGIVDVYLPDMRYSDDAMAAKYSSAPGYVRNNRASVKIMHEQTGDLVTDAQGIAEKGIIIRALVLPHGISGTAKTLEYIANDISKDTHVSLMSQYYPIYRSQEFPELMERITDAEYLKARDALNDLGLTNGWVQELPGNMNTDLGGHRIEPR